MLSPIFKTLPLRGFLRTPQTVTIAIAAARPFSTSTNLSSPVTLSFADVPKPVPQEAAKSQPIVILHGLFGSKQNWKSLSKAMASRLNTQVIALDLRNHGESGHSQVHDYSHMMIDVAHFLKERNLENPIIIGHSMGGKVAMTIALNQTPIDRLIVVDIAPINAKIPSEFAKYVESLKEIQAARIRRQSEADDILKKAVPDVGVRQFLLTNLKRDTLNDTFNFRVPLETIGNSLSKLGQFDFVPGQAEYSGKALFIKGNKSDYITEKGIELIKSLFPNARIEGLEAGHWTHAEKPEEFLKLVTEFAQEK
ncbi:hypothetical protein BX616_003381 [Lobosporangium transversale]|uniref:Alpha/Beta hydrolase protein n=1 Tax=Lobosporangium transversale TaxID=64571 RepID=A0A1Y2G7N6_9FUNG|nr:Alpha/Beta hydrolase protein [Lobosporangium transversale]KAF9898998.1 hypothetical protein BX616_003381 [Lobosporangium transversale]ORZ00028.1 Alpha/Beta hydrolase protein [Lobosporangium transversale]|eukprot:XP_021876069.1 Alpha/Beta hydrolase protein [Lobosporangium transversale]